MVNAELQTSWVEQFVNFVLGALALMGMEIVV
jgi:hypothetical protein